MAKYSARDFRLTKVGAQKLANRIRKAPAMRKKTAKVSKIKGGYFIYTYNTKKK